MLLFKKLNVCVLPSLPSSSAELNVSLFATLALTVISPPLSSLNVCDPTAPEPIVYRAALAVSKTTALIVMPAPRLIVVLLLPGPLNVAESPVPGAGTVLQLVASDQIPLVVPSQFPVAADAPRETIDKPKMRQMITAETDRTTVDRAFIGCLS